MNNILIVGATGFLGSACLPKLLSNKCSVISRKTPSTLTRLPNVQYYHLDLGNPKSREDFFSQYSYSHLLYLAWPITPPHNNCEQLPFAVNTINLFKEFYQHNPGGRIICTGSIHEMGNTTGLISNNFESAAPKNLYGLSKKFVYESTSILLSELNNPSFCWVRLSNVYGIRDHQGKLLTRIIRSEFEKKEFFIKSPDTVVDFVNIDDAATGICLALLSAYEGVVNIGGGHGYRLRDIKAYIENFLKQGKSPDGISYSLSGPILDIDIAQKKLGYIPLVNIEDGIKKYIDFLQKENVQND